MRDIRKLPKWAQAEITRQRDSTGGEAAMNATDLLPGITLFQQALEEFGDGVSDFAKSPYFTHNEAENVRRERLHAAAVKRRRKRKRGGPK